MTEYYRTENTAYEENKYDNQCCGSGMFIPDPGSEFFPSRIRIKEFKYFNPKKCFLSSRKYDLGCSSRIRFLTSYPSRIPGSKRHWIPDPDPDFLPIPDSGGQKGTGSQIRIPDFLPIPNPGGQKRHRIPDPDPQHC
jgi:hypothetical protein